MDSKIHAVSRIGWLRGLQLVQQGPKWLTKVEPLDFEAVLEYTGLPTGSIDFEALRTPP